MIASTILQSEVRRRIQRNNTDYSKKLTIPILDQCITEALQLCMKNSALLFEVRQDIALDLEPLVVRDMVLPVTTINNKVQAVLPIDQMKILRILAKASSTKCNDKKILIVRRVQHQKLSEALRSPFLKPSFEWEETVGLLNTHKFLDVYTDDFSIDEIKIDYIKRHPRIVTPSLTEDGYYEDADGTIIATDSGLFLDSADQMRTICDVAALIALRDVGDVTDFQTQLNKIMFSQSLFLGGEQK